MLFSFLSPSLVLFKREDGGFSQKASTLSLVAQGLVRVRQSKLSVHGNIKIERERERGEWRRGGKPALILHNHIILVLAP